MPCMQKLDISEVYKKFECTDISSIRSYHKSQMMLMFKGSLCDTTVKQMAGFMYDESVRNHCLLCVCEVIFVYMFRRGSFCFFAY